VARAVHCLGLEDPVAESLFAELKRYVRFLPADEEALRRFAPVAQPHFRRITEAFYRRLDEHEGARKVFAGPAQVDRLKSTLEDWLARLVSGPWDEAYGELRARIGRIHVRIGLPQRYMFGAMDLVRLALVELAERASRGDAAHAASVPALHKLLDLELAIMLEAYREAYVERVQADERDEKRTLADQLALSQARQGEAQRLAALGTMAAGLAHEIRNPLNGAHLQLSLARRRLSEVTGSEVSKARAAVDIASAEVKRLAGLVEDFLEFARPPPPRRALLDLRESAEVVVALLTSEAQQSGVELTLAPGPPVRAAFDGEKMKQVLINLVRNAIDAAAPAGRIRIDVVRRGGRVHLIVEDDGRGVPPEAPIFEPFFTSKASGTGLGLSIVHRIVTDHGGTIDVESRPGCTRFAIAIPEGGPGAPGPAPA
jgi:two-component system, NtrC family, sensor histidine kinase HydH